MGYHQCKVVSEYDVFNIKDSDKIGKQQKARFAIWEYLRGCHDPLFDVVIHPFTPVKKAFMSIVLAIN